MSKLKIKKKFIGATIFSKTLGQITIQENHAELLASEGRTNMLEGVKQPTKKLKPVKTLSINELRKIAKGMPGYKKSLTKDELIALINAPVEPE